MAWWQVLLFPFAIIYDIITSCRNWLYDIGILKSWKFPNVKIISVGNLSVGGTGKTPMVEYLIRKGVSSGKSIAVLSRGYGRETKGLRLVSDKENASTVGDEPYSYFLQFGENIKVVVAEKRVEGIQFIASNFRNVELIILDDAFQHRSVCPDFSILLTTFERPFWKDFVLPSGLLRESRKGARRADQVVVTKAPDAWARMSANFSNESSLCITSVKYGELRMVNGDYTDADVYVIAGLADNAPFFIQTRSIYNVVECYSFRDHMQYRKNDLLPIVNKAKDRGAVIITSFKDAVKLMNAETFKDVTWGYIPIEVKFLKGEAELNKKLAPYFDTALQTEH